MNAGDIFRCLIGCEIMFMIKARIRLIFSRNILFYEKVHLRIMCTLNPSMDQVNIFKEYSVL